MPRPRRLRHRVERLVPFAACSLERARGPPLTTQERIEHQLDAVLPNVLTGGPSHDRAQALKGDVIALHRGSWVDPLQRADDGDFGRQKRLRDFDPLPLPVRRPPGGRGIDSQSFELPGEPAAVGDVPGIDGEPDADLALRQRHAGQVEDFAARRGQCVSRIVLEGRPPLPLLSLPELHPARPQHERHRKGDQDTLDDA